MLLYSFCVTFAFLIAKGAAESKIMRETPSLEKNSVKDDICDEHSPKCLETKGFCILSGKKTVECVCPKGTDFVKGAGCKVNYCKFFCQDAKGVKCIGDPYIKKGLRCICEKEDEDFDYIHGKCRVQDNTCDEHAPKCLETRGFCISSGKKTVECVCPEGTEYAKGAGCKENYCKSFCKHAKGVKCIGDPYDKEDVQCICEKKDEVFSYPQEKCIAKDNTCDEHSPKCLETGGSCISSGNKTVKCVCPERTEFVKGAGCKVNYCKFFCKDVKGVKCIGDAYDQKNVKCTCENELEDFSYLEQKCKVSFYTCMEHSPKCLETGGSCILSGDKTVKCVCPERTEFVKGAGCKVNYCKYFCGNAKGVLCVGDPYDEKDMECTCENEIEVKNDICDDQSPKCLETGGSCILLANKTVKCVCPEGINFVKGTGCQG